MSESTDFNANIPEETIVNPVEENLPVEAAAESVDDYRAVIQKKAKFYKKIFKDMDEGERKTSWNWSAFLFSNYWTFYRKMYGFGFIFIILQLLFFIPNVFSRIADPVEEPEVFSWRIVSFFTGLLLSVLYSVFANWLYKKKVDKIIRSADGKAESERSEYLRKRGGVSVAACIIPIALDIAYITAVLLLLYFEAKGAAMV